jgi:hypothetical protein
MRHHQGGILALLLRRPLIGLLLFFATLSASAQELPSRPDAQEIIRQSLSHWRRSIDAAQKYTFQERSVETELEKDGDAKKTEIETHQISIIYGEPYAKLIARDDKPLSDKDQQKEEEKLNKFFNKQKNMSDEERQRNRDKQHDKFRREIADELPVMLDYEIVGEELFNGQPVWILSGTPKKGYHSNSMAGKLLSKLSGKVWITKSDFQWVKAEADLGDDFTVGWFIFKLHKGTHLEFEQTRVNDEVWLPKRAFVQGSGRIAVKTGRFRNETTYSNYQRFSTDVKITGFAEVPDTSTPASPPQ